MPAPQVEALLPVYNEAEIIESTIREWRDELTPRVAAGFIICEDGSEDGTRGILERLGRELPVRLNLRGSRRGYSQAAVRDGMRMPQSDYLLCVDSDGQCDPKDFWRFREARGTADLILGRRLERADPALRRAFRRVSYCIYQPVLRTPAHDPSCPYALMSKRTVARLVDELSDVREGFWWEFVARAHRRGCSIREVPIHPRRRSHGETQVYRPGKTVEIFPKHVVAVLRIWSDTRKRDR